MIKISQKNIPSASLIVLASSLLLIACGTKETQSEIKSICGYSNDMQDVEYYNGDLGVSQAFVAANEAPVGIIADDTGTPFCSGTLISSNLFLTAGHCTYSTPTSVAFNYQVGKEYEAYAVTEIVETGRRLDYAILKLDGSPGDTYGVASLSAALPETGSILTIIQHPQGEKKQIEAGTFAGSSGSKIYYGGLDTQGGSSGSGVLDESGYLVGVHTNGGCTARGGYNSGVSIQAIPEASGVLN